MRPWRGRRPTRATAGDRGFRELRSKNGHEPPLELRQLVRLRRAAEMARAQPSGKPAVGDVRRVRPIQVGPFQIERLGDRAQITLVVDRVRGGEGAVDVEDSELGRGEIPLWSEGVSVVATSREVVPMRFESVPLRKRSSTAAADSCSRRRQGRQRP